VAGLRERELLAGEADEADRRSVKLQLTDAGQAVQRAMKLQAARLNALANAGLTATERQHLLDLLQRVRRNLGLAA
jgi:DNA-binding MarR family transcriptional regulator